MFVESLRKKLLLVFPRNKEEILIYRERKRAARKERNGVKRKGFST
jgi:hypothetical protein